MTDDSAITAPTERSMPRVTMTSSWPIATTAITAEASITLPRFDEVRKSGVSALATPKTISSMSAGPARSTHSPHRRLSNERMVRRGGGASGWLAFAGTGPSG